MAISSRRKIGIGVIIAASLVALLVPFLFRGSPINTAAGAGDSEGPTTSIMLHGVLGQAGWYVSSVTVTLSAHDARAMGSIHYKTDGDPESIATTSQGKDLSVNLTPISAEGTHIIAYWSVDKAGNVEKAKSASFQIDTSAPTVSIDMKDKYYQTENVVITFSSADLQSEAASMATLDVGTPQARTVANRDQIPAISLANGDHTLTVQASDASGNSVTMTKTFKVEKLHDTIIGYINGGQINNQGVGNSLIVKADHALAKIDSGNTNAGLNQLRALENHLTAQSGHHVDPSSASDIMDITNAIMLSTPISK